MDEALLRALNQLYVELPGAWDAIDSVGAKVLLVAGVLGWLLVRGRFAWIALTFLVVAVTDPLCSRVIKPMVERERPCAVLDGLYLPGGSDDPHCGAGASMPSSHAANMAAMAMVLDAPPLYAAAAVVAVQRVVTGQHWPSDVAAGLAVGGLIGLAARTLALRHLPRKR
jgi:undecaprenyl-diphosphatase